MRIELLSRWWLPGIGWIRSHHEHLWIDLDMRFESTVMLPPPMFSLNAASLVRLWFTPNNGRMTFSMDLDSSRPFYRQDWRESRLWSQVTFPSPYGFLQDHEIRPSGPIPPRRRMGDGLSYAVTSPVGKPPERINRSPWWLRWRCPDADHDIMTVVNDALTTLGAAVHEDPYPNGRVAATVAELRREIVMWQLGGPVGSRRAGAQASDTSA